MAFAVRMTMEGADSSQYLAVHREIIKKTAPAGLILHTAGEVDGDWAIFDIWETPAAFEAFSQSLIPVVQAQGITAQPKVTITELFNAWVPEWSTLQAIASEPLPVAVSV
jgi:hypothetical protein